MNLAYIAICSYTMQTENVEVGRHVGLGRLVGLGLVVCR